MAHASDEGAGHVRLIEHDLCGVDCFSGGFLEGSDKFLFQDWSIFVSGPMPTCYFRNRASGDT
jgi:hypothetical protein